jgi:hypothetical protein
LYGKCFVNSITLKNTPLAVFLRLNIKRTENMTFDTLLEVKKVAGTFILWGSSKTLKGLGDLNTPSV